MLESPAPGAPSRLEAAPFSRHEARKPVSTGPESHEKNRTYSTPVWQPGRTHSLFYLFRWTC